jgi:hypothetical protein
MQFEPFYSHVYGFPTQIAKLEECIVPALLHSTSAAGSVLLNLLSIRVTLFCQSRTMVSGRSMAVRQNQIVAMLSYKGTRKGLL